MGSLPIEWPLPKNEGLWQCIWTKNEDRFTIEDGCLKINFVAGCHGLASGAAFRGNPHNVFPADAATLTYSVYFPEGFDFVKGGKLPGMNIGCNTEDSATGGEWSPDCGSFRIMFRERGAAIGYAYFPLAGAGQGSFDAQSDAFKEVAKVKGGAGIDLWHSRKDANDMMLKAGEWNTISMSVNLGTAGEANGSVSVTTNGVTRSCDGILWRTDPNCKLCALNFVAFFGGGDDEWNSPVDSYCMFKDISLQVDG
jgi:hypothetical protein